MGSPVQSGTDGEKCGQNRVYNFESGAFNHSATLPLEVERVDTAFCQRSQTRNEVRPRNCNLVVTMLFPKGLLDCFPACEYVEDDSRLSQTRKRRRSDFFSDKLCGITDY